MKTPAPSPPWFRRNLRKLLPALLSLLAPALLPAQAFHPAVTKLHSGKPAANNEFGCAVALSDRFLLVGEPFNDDKAGNAGAAHLYDARSGRYLRTLYAGDPAAGDFFGSGVALSGNLALVGAAMADFGGKDAAYVFDVTTGRQLRKLTAPDDGPGIDYFGWNVAINGDIALVGAYGDDGTGNNSGAAYLFDARSGAPIATGHAVPGKLTASDTVVDDLFGFSVALDGGLALIGAQWDDDNGPDSGSAYVFDARSGQQLRKLTAGADGAASDRFGFSVALNGGIALIGAPSKISGGAAYLFDAHNGVPLATGHAVPGKLTAGDAAAADFFGNSVALDGSLALIGTRHDDDLGNSSGSAYLFDTQSGAELAKLHASDGAALDEFGYSVALSGGLALIGSRQDDDHGANSGSAYFLRPLASPLTHLDRAAAKGSFAPGAPGTAFQSFPSAYINPNGVVVLRGALSGSGASGGRNQGVWNALTGSNGLALRVKDQDLGGGRQAAKILNAWSNRSGNALIQATLAGPGVNAANNQAVFRDDGANLLQIARTGDDFGGHLGGAAPQKFIEVGQSGANYVAINAQLKHGSGVDKRSDSALFFVNHAGVPTVASFREGDDAVAGFKYGQLFSRVAVPRNSNFIGFGAALIPNAPGPAVQAVFASDSMGVALLNPAKQGDPAHPLDAGIKYRSFFAESMGNDYLIWRASLSGSEINGKNNEGLWHELDLRLIARKDRLLDPAVVNSNNDPYGVHGLKVARLLQFWPAGGTLQVLLLVKLSGPGVKAGNDLALCLWNRALLDDRLHILLREGQVAVAADAAAVNVIQRVDVDPVNGHYTVLCSLTGAAARNQALFTGRIGLGNATTQKALREPSLKLRKGTLHMTSGAMTRLRSLSLSPATDKTGTGGKGQGQVINQNGRVALTASFDNQAVEVLNGKP